MDNPLPPLPRCRLYPSSWLSLHKQPASETASGFPWQIACAMDFSQSWTTLWKKKKTRQESGVWFVELSANGKVVNTGEPPSQKAKDQTTEAAVGIQNPRQTDTEV